MTDDPNKLGYQAIQDKGRRQAPKVAPQAESDELLPSQRRKLTATAQDQSRNLSLVAWLIRRHLDNVSRFYPQCRTDSEDLNNYVERLLTIHGRPENFDVGRRLSRDESMRLFEATKVVQGDAGWLFAKDGRIQGIEGDRIAKPASYHRKPIPKQWDKKIDDEGLVVDPLTGAATHYCLCSRDKTSLVFADVVPAESLAFDGYWQRYDQRRGVSPLASAINACQDLAEAQEWTILKIKLHALFGLAYYRDAGQPGADPFPSRGTQQPSTDALGTPTGNAPPKSIEMKSGVAMFNVPEGSKVQTIESQTPPSSSITFEELLIRIALLALDIPYTFYDSRGSNFSAVIADRQLYVDSVGWKQDKNRTILRRYGRWKLAYWSMADARLQGLMRDAGVDVLELADALDWMAAGVPWLDKLKEVNGDVLAISQGLDSRQRICRRRGQDFFEIARELGAEQRFAEQEGVTLAIGQPGQAQTQTGGSDAGITDQQQ